MNTELPEIVFQLLAIAMALAAFLPALIYSYSKDLLDELEQCFEHTAHINVSKELVEFTNNIPKFVFAVDLIVTQSIILVIFSAFLGITIFFSTLIPHRGIYIGVALIILSIFYAFRLYLSYKQITEMKNCFELFWKDDEDQIGWKTYRLRWIIFTILVFLTILAFSILFMCEICKNVHWHSVFNCMKAYKNGCKWLNFIVGSLTFFLILSATS